MLFARIKPLFELSLPANFYGFRKRRQAADLTHALALAVEKCKSFNRPFFWAKLDIKKAFDHVSHHRILEGLLLRGVAVLEARAMVKFFRLTVLQFSLPNGVGGEFEVRPTRGVLQGLSASPLLFNMVLADALELWNVERSPKLDGGLRFDGLDVESMFFADDGIIMGNSLADPQKLIRWYHGRFSEYGFTIQLGKSLWGANRVVHGDLLVNGEVIPKSPHPYIPILGVQIAMNGSTLPSIRHRLQATWHYWAERKHIYCNRSAKSLTRIRLMCKIVAFVLLWGHEHWKLTDAERKILRGAQIRMVRLALCIPNYSWEEIGHYLRRGYREARAFLLTNGIEFWDERAVEQQLTWAGHMHRNHNMGLAGHIYNFRNLQWQQTMCVLSGGKTFGRALAGNISQWGDELYWWGLSGGHV